MSGRGGDVAWLTGRPWAGRCWTTGMTLEWFRTMLDGCKARPAAQAAAVRICRAYGIAGETDPAYIANVIEAELVRLGSAGRHVARDRAEIEEALGRLRDEERSMIERREDPG